MGLELNQIAVPVSQEEIDIAKATYFKNGGKVTYLNPSRVIDKEIRKFVIEKFADRKFVDDVTSNNLKEAVE
jgi:hypothetical protein